MSELIIIIGAFLQLRESTSIAVGGDIIKIIESHCSADLMMEVTVK